MQILDTGLLPGKLIQQLNGQTQRLLGQQSLAAYTGLQVDINRIRLDNDARVNVPRKAGLIIYEGPNLTKDMKERMQEEARAKYSLSAEQIKEAEDQIEDLMAIRRGATHVADKPDIAELLSVNPADLQTREAKLALLKRLYLRIQRLNAAMNLAKKKLLSMDNDEENQGINAPRRSTFRKASTTNKQVKVKSSKRVASEIQKRTKRSAPAAVAATSKSEADRNEMNEAFNVALESDVSTLLDMGFSKKQARDALDESGGDLEMAAIWLMEHCV